MANTKVSALPAATGVGLLDAHEIPVNEAGVSKKVTGVQVRTKGDAVSAAADHLARIKLAADTTYRAFIGLDVANNGVLEFGPGGSAARDVRFERIAAGTVLLDSNGATAPTELSLRSTAGQRAGFDLAVTGDSVTRAQMYGDATLQGFQFGTGGATHDLKLSRLAAGIAGVDSNGTANESRVATVSTAGQRSGFSAGVAGDTQTRAQIYGDATMIGFQFGSGAAAADTRVRWVSAKLLEIDDAAGGAATLNVVGAIRQGGVPIPKYVDSATANQQLSGASDQYLTDSKIAVPVGKLRLGSVLHWRFAIDKTGAGTATPVFKVFVGTLGTTSDTARLTFTLPAQTGVIDTGFVDITVTCRGPLSSSGIFQGILELQHNLAVTGLSNIANPVVAVTSGAFDVTTASLFVGVSCNPGASGVWNFQQVIADTLNL